MKKAGGRRFRSNLTTGSRGNNRNPNGRGGWSVLALLFVVRTAIAIQYQSVAAIAPSSSPTAASTSRVGLYFAPGIVLALPGAAVGRYFGDKRTAVARLASQSGV